MNGSRDRRRKSGQREAARIMLETIRIRLNACIYVGDSRPASVSISTTFAIEITEALIAAEGLLS